MYWSQWDNWLTTESSIHDLSTSLTLGGFDLIKLFYCHHFSSDSLAPVPAARSQRHWAAQKSQCHYRGAKKGEAWPWWLVKKKWTKGRSEWMCWLWRVKSDGRDCGFLLTCTFISYCHHAQSFGCQGWSTIQYTRCSFKWVIWDCLLNVFRCWIQVFVTGILEATGFRDTYRWLSVLFINWSFSVRDVAVSEETGSIWGKIRKRQSYFLCH